MTNYGAVLACVSRHGRITARQIGLELGITERSVMRIIARLEADGYLERGRRGRGNYYTVNAHLPFKRPGQPDGLVREFLDVVLGRRSLGGSSQ